MKKTISVCLCFFVLVGVFALAGCSGKQESGTTLRTVVDIRGKEVTLPETVEKYGILYSSAVPMCGMLDENLAHMVLCPTLYADWTYRLFPNIDDHAIVVDKRSVTAEQIIESGAQVVFWSSSSHEELVASLEQMNIVCVNVAVSNADDLLKALDIIATTFGTDYARNVLEKYNESFAKYSDMAKKCASTLDESDKKSILVLNDDEDTTGFGESTYEAYWTDLAGFSYIVPSKDGSNKVTLTKEQIYEFDPDIIVFEGFIDEERMKKDPAWSELRAIKNDMFIAAPSVLDTWSKPGSEAPLQYIWSIARFYPEVAKDIDIAVETKTFYKQFYNYEMSDTEITEVLAGHRIVFD